MCGDHAKGHSKSKSTFSHKPKELAPIVQSKAQKETVTAKPRTAPAPKPSNEKPRPAASMMSTAVSQQQTASAPRRDQRSSTAAGTASQRVDRAESMPVVAGRTQAPIQANPRASNSKVSTVGRCLEEYKLTVL
jgi:hypothetical protein